MSGRPAVRTFTVPKQGSSLAENEDRAFVRGRRSLLVGLGDGATESALAREWADALVTSRWKNALLGKYSTVTDEVSAESVAEWIGPLRAAFTGEHANKERPWYAREKVRMGAHATLLVFRLFPGGRWKAAVCGDACLIRVAGSEIMDAFPICSAGDFSNSPDLISSLPEAALPRLVVHSGGRVNTQTHFVLATDAIAAWLIESRTTSDRMDRLLECETEQDFEQLVASERHLGALRNDDTTVVVIPT